MTMPQAIWQREHAEPPDDKTGLCNHCPKSMPKRCPWCGFQPETPKPMNKALKRVLCPECGAVRICHRGSPYAVCPNGHGKLVKRFTKVEARKALADTLPLAHRVGRNKFTVDGHEGLFGYRNGSGRRPVAPGTTVGPDEVLARHVTRTRRLVRVFARKGPNRRVGLSGTDG